MSIDLSNTKSLIIVFAMEGCPACHSYLPRLTKMIEGFKAHGAPIVIHDGRKKVRPGQILVVVYDGGSQDPGIVQLADAYKIEALPTTILLTHNAAPVKLEGELPDEDIYELLASATIANR